eukprot:UN01654
MKTGKFFDYPSIRLSCRNQAQSLYIHRLVAFHFVGPQPTTNHVVHHKNHKKCDGNACNLEWVTQSQNSKKACELKSKPTVRAVHKITNQTIIRYESVKEAAIKNKKGLSTIYGT